MILDTKEKGEKCYSTNVLVVVEESNGEHLSNLNTLQHYKDSTHVLT